MEKIIILFSAATMCSAIFFPLLNLPKNNKMVNVCVYSVDPTKYPPKCFLCPSDIYPVVLQTCVRAGVIPANVSYTQARCLEQNCGISRGKRSVSSLRQDDNSLEWPENNSNSVIELLHLKHPSTNGTASYFEGEDISFDIVQEEETYASEEADLEELEEFYDVVD